MGFYRVRWEIDLDADCPRDAAERAKDMQQDIIGNTATIFEVEDMETGWTFTVDLLEP